VRGRRHAQGRVLAVDSRRRFERIAVVRDSRYAGSSGCLPEGVDTQALTQVMSIGVRAYKPNGNGK
jgi:hypothetical protein